MLDIHRILTELEDERDRLDRAITLLKGIESPGTAGKPAAPRKSKSKPRRRGLTPAGRKRLSEMMKKRWAERRKASKGS
jgi:hypothetical protein